MAREVISPGNSQRIFELGDDPIKKRQTRRWMKQFSRPTAERISGELFDAIIASGEFRQKSDSRLVGPGKIRSAEETSEEFKARVTEHTIIFTKKQISEFKRHGFTAIGVPITRYGLTALALQDRSIIDLKSLLNIAEGKQTMEPQLKVWFLVLERRGTVIAIARPDSGHQPKTGRVLDITNTGEIQGLSVHFSDHLSHKIERPYGIRIEPLYDASSYGSGVPRTNLERIEVDYPFD